MHLFERQHVLVLLAFVLLFVLFFCVVQVYIDLFIFFFLLFIFFFWSSKLFSYHTLPFFWNPLYHSAEFLELILLLEVKHKHVLSWIFKLIHFYIRRLFLTNLLNLCVNLNSCGWLEHDFKEGKEITYKMRAEYVWLRMASLRTSWSDTCFKEVPNTNWKYTHNNQMLMYILLDANTPPPAANPRSEQNTNTGSFELWAL